MVEVAYPPMAAGIDAAATWLPVPHFGKGYPLKALSQAAELCEAIAAPDFRPIGRKVRLLAYSEVAHLSPRLSGGCCAGWTSVALDLILRDHLQLPEGERAFVAIIRDDRQLSDADIIGTALHELAHGLADLSIPLATATGPALGIFQSVSVASLPAAPSLDRGDRHHGDRFTRAAIHVAYRAKQLGYAAGLQPMGIRRSARTAITLADEPRELAHLPIGQILDSTPSPAFARLWAA